MKTMSLRSSVIGLSCFSALVALIFGWIFLGQSRHFLRSAGQQRLETTSLLVEERVARLLGQCPETLSGLQSRLNLPGSGFDGLVRWSKAWNERVLDSFVGELRERPQLTELSLTGPSGLQLGVWRDESQSLVRYRVEQTGQRFFKVSSDGARVEVQDPRSHATYQTLVEPDNLGSALWSDLHYSQFDASLPPARQRVVVSLQQTVAMDRDGWGVLRVAIDTKTLQSMLAQAAPSQHSIFLSDSNGEIIASSEPNKSLRVTAEDDLRIESPLSIIAKQLVSKSSPAGSTIQVDASSSAAHLLGNRDRC